MLRALAPDGSPPLCFALVQRPWAAGVRSYFEFFPEAAVTVCPGGVPPFPAPESALEAGVDAVVGAGVGATVTVLVAVVG